MTKPKAEDEKVLPTQRQRNITAIINSASLKYAGKVDQLQVCTLIGLRVQRGSGAPNEARLLMREIAKSPRL